MNLVVSLRFRKIKFLEYSIAFQIGSFLDAEEINRLINIDGDLFVMVNGDFGRLEIGESGRCSFSTLCESKHQCHHPCRHLLFQV